MISNTQNLLRLKKHTLMKITHTTKSLVLENIVILKQNEFDAKIKQMIITNKINTSNKYK